MSGEDTVICLSPNMFVSRGQAYLEDVSHNGFCGYNAVALQNKHDVRSICKLLFDYGQNSQDVKLKEARRRWNDVYMKCISEADTLPYNLWMRGNIDCELYVVILHIL